MAAAADVSAQVAINVGFEADVAQKLVEAFKATDADHSGFVENDEVCNLLLLLEPPPIKHRERQPCKRTWEAVWAYEAQL
jgi:Ca2+-binding EF-hand superfamily protein